MYHTWNIKGMYHFYFQQGALAGNIKQEIWQSCVPNFETLYMYMYVDGKPKLDLQTHSLY